MKLVHVNSKIVTSLLVQGLNPDYGEVIVTERAGKMLHFASNQ